MSAGGFSNLLWFVGVVEYRQDGANDGRVKIRAFGIHNEDKTKVATRDLPWAIVIDGSYGATQCIPDVGDWVFGFFMDGSDAQHPMILGRVPGINLQLPPEASAPGDVSMIPAESLCKYGKPPLHRAMGGEDAEVGQATIQQALKKNNIESASGELWSEPPIVSPERDLDNRIFTSKNDNNFVVLSDADDGRGTYILVSHSSGSVFQIDSDGSILVKSFGDTYNSTEGFTMNRTEKDMHTVVGNDWTLKVERGSGKVFINGDLDIECENFNVVARSVANINAGVAVNVSAGRVGILSTADDVNITAVNDLKMKAGSPANGGGIYSDAHFGDIRSDSYKMNLTSTTYTKIHSLGLPVTPPYNKLIPYPDIGHKGVHITSRVLVNIDTLGTGIGVGGVVSISGGIVNMNSKKATGITSDAMIAMKADANIDIEATGVLNMTATVGLVNIGVATLASATLIIVDGAKALAKSGQQLTSLFHPSGPGAPARVDVKTESAVNVAPPKIPGTRTSVGYIFGGGKQTRETGNITSRMPDD